MSKIIAISTYCTWTSYGSVLQSYSLSYVIKNSNAESFVFVDWKDIDPLSFTPILNKGLRQFVSSTKIYLLKKQLIEQCNKTTAFINNYIDRIEYKDYSDILNNPPIADKYITGSDQVFNPNLIKKNFFLDFVKDKSKKFTYACSMGSLSVPEKSENIFKQLINNFSEISVREKDNIDILKKYNQDAKYFRHIDPTFLIDVSQWKSIESEYTIKGKFILVYPLYWDTKYNEVLKELHKKTGITIVVVSNELRRIYANKHLYNVGVQEFLWLIDNAEAVVTSSFHGTALATVFNKNFSVIINPDAPSRINNLISLLGIKPLKISELLSKDIDYTEVNKRIHIEKKRSLKYLAEIIEDEK